MSDTSTASAVSLEKIVSNGYCIGCGACAAASNGITLEMSDEGQYCVNVSENTMVTDAALQTCPFSDEGPNEDVLGNSFYAENCTHDVRMGWHHNLYAGHIAEGKFRENGASGGVITWILSQLLENNLVDAVIHVRQSDRSDTGVLFKYAISRTTSEISERAKSRYYPIEISEVMEEVRRTPGRYAFVGLPCYVKAVRKMAGQDQIIKERVTQTVGLVCGHLKSETFSDALAWEKGINPGDLEEIDFRVKLPTRGASDYGVYVKSSEEEHTAPVRSFIGGDWGLNFFRHSACDYCDDVFAETADVAVGDAWLPEYSGESAGNSVVLVRSPVIGQLIENARSEGRVNFDHISADTMAQSQAGGLRDRREGLAYRLHLKEREQVWAPRKRVDPSNDIPKKRRQIYDQRFKLREMSHEAWQQAVSKGSFQEFRVFMQPHAARMRAFYKRPLVLRIIGKILRSLRRLSRTNV
ncbi:Coenzyme F420 hydrogenase/dehydrogenase, beta subunit C-terminal domain [Pseudophaeobacter sp.]|uniref:Coenzyme F420 hydrogenase/dehydrogenase, beta subunit C-terminal domain n=1 Tax=Pseudophaeobacter sp. TaxID=1971739 RepID=UPI003299BE21